MKMLKLLSIVVLMQGVLSHYRQNHEFRCDYEHNEEAGGWFKFQEIPADWPKARLLCRYEGAVQWGCGYVFDQDCEGWFKFHDVPMVWNEARLTCHYEGAELASPTPNLLDKMTDIVKDSNIPSGRVFTGIHATFSSRHFATIEGMPISRFPHSWAPGEPSNTNNPENCIALTQYGTLIDYSCDTTLPFICYKKSKGLKLNTCGTFDNEYTLDNRTGSCYKFHRYPHSWSRAHMICEAEGGYLAVINSETEAQVMRDILARNPETSLPPTAYKGGASIGFRDVDEHGRWITVQGQTLKEAGYDKFAQGQPDNYGGQQLCGNTFRSGLLDDNHCESLNPFICEKDPKNILYNY